MHPLFHRWIVVWISARGWVCFQPDWEGGGPSPQCCFDKLDHAYHKGNVSACYSTGYGAMVEKALIPFSCMTMAHQCTGKSLSRHHDWRGRRSKGCVIRCQTPLRCHCSAHENSVPFLLLYKLPRDCGVRDSSIHAVVIHENPEHDSRSVPPGILAKLGTICFAKLR